LKRKEHENSLLDDDIIQRHLEKEERMIAYKKGCIKASDTLGGDTIL
jgi:hypothetical protein